MVLGLVSVKYLQFISLCMVYIFTSLSFCVVCLYFSSFLMISFPEFVFLPSWVLCVKPVFLFSLVTSWFFFINLCFLWFLFSFTSLVSFSHLSSADRAGVSCLLTSPCVFIDSVCLISLTHPPSFLLVVWSSALFLPSFWIPSSSTAFIL